MRKAALTFVLSVLAPSIVLAGLAFRSLRDQELIIERQRTLLYEGAAQGVIKDILDFFSSEQRRFSETVEKLLRNGEASRVVARFDSELLKVYPLAEVGFAVSTNGQMHSPSLLDRAEARRFRLENELFLTSKETAEVYWDGPKGNINLSKLDRIDAAREPRSKSFPISASTQFRDLIGTNQHGILARYLQDELKLMVWYRSTQRDETVFGALLRLPEIVRKLEPLLRVDPSLQGQIVLALLNEQNQPVAFSEPEFQPPVARPFNSLAIGDYMPHWKIGVFLRNPAKLAHAASSVQLTAGLLIAVLLTAIIVGAWLIVSDLNREMKSARQKTDFVSNVSHELKTPLTSIRMFSELLAEGRVNEPVKQRTFAAIIATETARLTRLINNVLDFSRMERGEKSYNFQSCDLTALVAGALRGYQPHLEAEGFAVQFEAPVDVVWVNADTDAFTQVVLNLLSNAEKYSPDQKEILVNVMSGAGGKAEVQVLDRGRGVPRGLEEKIFEQFFRAHDSLADGIQGAGLGLSLARQIVQAHGGEVAYHPRDGGGSCFVVSIPAKKGSTLYESLGG
jgi:signal transduction histidine kinase